MVQTCVVHLIRASMRFVAYADRNAVAAMLRPIYTAPDEDAARMAMAAFGDSTWGRKYPAAVATWENAWDRFTPFLAFGPAPRKVIHTTNSIVTLRPLLGVVDVVDALDRSVIVPAGHNNLQPSNRSGRRRCLCLRADAGGKRGARAPLNMVVIGNVPPR